MKKGFTLSQIEAGRKNEVKQKMKMEFTNSTQWASESVKCYYRKDRWLSLVSQNSTVICFEAF